MTPRSIDGGSRRGSLAPCPQPDKGESPLGRAAGTPHLGHDQVLHCFVPRVQGAGQAHGQEDVGLRWEQKTQLCWFPFHLTPGASPQHHNQSCAGSGVPPTLSHGVCAPLLCATPCAHSKPRTPHTTELPG